MSNKLALFGGKPVCTGEWPFYNMIGQEEKDEVLQVLDSGVLSDFVASANERFLGGTKVRALEQAWAAHFAVPHAVAMNSCTSCLHAAIAAAGVGSGDEVIVPQLGMSAAAAVVTIAGATPVFADCDPRSMLIDPASAEAAVTDRTKAIIVVHLAGHPAPMREIMAIADSHRLLVIEDNAQAPGALHHGQLAGTIGHIGCFSLNCHKIIQCGEGGIACTRDPELAFRLQLFRNHGEKCLPGFGRQELASAGLNLRMTEMEAAVARPQLAKLASFNAGTVRLADYLTARLALPGLNPPRVAPGCTHVYYIYHWEYDARQTHVPAKRFAEAVQAEGFPVYAHYGYLMSRLPPFADGHLPQEELPNDSRYPGACAAIRNSLWTMLIRPHLSEKDMDLLVEGISKVYDNRDLLSD